MRVAVVRQAGLAAMAAALAAAVSPRVAHAASPAGSYAYGLSAGIASQGTGTVLPAVAYVKGSTPAKYDRRALAPFASEGLGLVSNGTLIGEVIVSASSIATHAYSNGSSNPTVTTEADGSIGAVKLTVELLPSGGTAPPPLVTLEVKKLTASTTDTQTLPSVAAITGTAKFGALSLGGSLFGSSPLTFAGAAPANTVLYDDPHITVTLNKQTVTGTIECTPNCQFVPKAMVADAVSIYVHGAKVNGKPFFGNIILGETSASNP